MQNRFFVNHLPVLDGMLVKSDLSNLSNIRNEASFPVCQGRLSFNDQQVLELFVKGPVFKGDLLAASEIPGVASVFSPPDIKGPTYFGPIAIANEDLSDISVKKISVIIDYKILSEASEKA